VVRCKIHVVVNLKDEVISSFVGIDKSNIATSTDHQLDGSYLSVLAFGTGDYTRVATTIRTNVSEDDV
jgi:hypothetical protein